MNNEEQYAITHDQLAREAYKHLHELGLNDNSDIRKKLEDLSRFMGEFGFSRLTNEQIGSINMWLKDLVSLNYQFINGLLQINRKKETLKKEFFKQLEEEIRATEEDNGYDKREIPDMTPDEEDRFENDRQGGKSIFDDEPEEEY